MLRGCQAAGGFLHGDRYLEVCPQSQTIFSLYSSLTLTFSLSFVIKQRFEYHLLL